MLRIAMIFGLTVVFTGIAACGEEDPAGSPDAVIPDVGIPDTEFSLYPGSVFDVPVPPAFVESDALPGSNAKIPVMFVGAPPQIPHGIQDFLPIDREENACLNCHLIEKDPDEDAPLLPGSHRLDLRAQPNQELNAAAGARWVCTACHVPVTDAKVLPECAPGGDSGR